KALGAVFPGELFHATGRFTNADGYARLPAYWTGNISLSDQEISGGFHAKLFCSDGVRTENRLLSRQEKASCSRSRQDLSEHHQAGGQGRGSRLYPRGRNPAFDPY